MVNTPTWFDKAPQVYVLGLGPGGPGFLSVGDLELIKAAKSVIFRTLEHPGVDSVVDLVKAQGIPYQSMDALYESAEDFVQLYQEISDHILNEANELRDGYLCYIVPGSPMVGEATVVTLCASGGSRVRTLPGVSFLDIAWDRLGRDPISGVTVADCLEVLSSPQEYLGSLLLMQCYSTEIVEDLLARSGQIENCQPVLLHHLGLHDELVVALEEDGLPNEFVPDHLTSIFLSGWDNPLGNLSRLWEVIRTLRVACPWDAEQTHGSLSRHLLEEAHETLEAIDEVEMAQELEVVPAMSHLAEELGDLLIQVLFHANLAREAGYFSIDDVAVRTTEKLIRRHPHVFADVVVSHSQDVVANWEKIKLEEKSRNSVLEGIPSSLPSAAKYQKLQRKLISLGRESRSGSEVVAEIAELAVGTSVMGDPGGKPTSEDAEEMLERALELSLVCGIDVEGVLRRLNRDLVGAIESLEAEGRVL